MDNPATDLEATALRLAPDDILGHPEPAKPPGRTLHREPLLHDQLAATFRPMHMDVNAIYLARGSASDVWVVYKSSIEQPTEYVSKMLRIAPKDFDDWTTDDASSESSARGISWRHFVKTYKDKISQWTTLKHANIVQVYDNQQDLNLHVEFCSNGCVRDYLKSRSYMTVEKERIISDVLEGLGYLHCQDPSIVHGSLNAGKLFVDMDGNTKIGEFGLTALCYPIATFAPSIVFAGFSRWMGPELVDTDPDSDNMIAPTVASDIWALGCTIFEIVSEQVPYSKYAHDVKIYQAILSGEHPGHHNESPVDQYTSTLWLIMESCWSMKPSERPSIGRILKQHPSTSSSLFKFTQSWRQSEYIVLPETPLAVSPSIELPKPSPWGNLRTKRRVLDPTTPILAQYSDSVGSRFQPEVGSKYLGDYKLDSTQNSPPEVLSGVRRRVVRHSADAGPFPSQGMAPNLDPLLPRSSPPPDHSWGNSLIDPLPPLRASASESPINSINSEIIPFEALLIGRESKKEDQYFCQICGKIFRGATWLWTHTKLAHDSETKKYRCEVEGCTRIFSAEVNMRKHVRVHQAQITAMSNDTHASEEIPVEQAGPSHVLNMFAGSSSHTTHGH